MPPHELLYAYRGRAISAHKPMSAEFPNISALCHRLNFIIHFWSNVLYHWPLFLSSNSPIKIKCAEIELWQFLCEQIKVPLALITFVIHQPQGVHLLRREIINAYNRYLTHFKLLRG